MQIRFLLFGILYASLLNTAGCQSPAQRGIKGQLTLSNGWKPVVYLIQPRQFGDIAASYTGAVVDSARVDADGHFEFSEKSLPAYPTLFELCVQPTGSRYANGLTDDNPLTANYMPVVVQAGKPLDIRAAIARFQASFALANPDAENRLLLQLRDLRHQAFLRDSALLNPAHTDEHNLMAHEEARMRFRQSLMAFADTCTSLWPTLTAARWVSPESDYERVPEFIVRLCDKWQKSNLDEVMVAQLCKIRERLPVLVGDSMPDYAMPMLDGSTIQLYQLLGSKITIIDIWASWCMPCRKENRETLAPLWATYQQKGLQIIGYSIDSSPAAWKAAISKDGAAWPHASHLTGDATPLLDTLRITTIPANLILDASGKIIAKNVHGAELRVLVKAALKE